MIDHISVGVSDLERSARFYEAALAPLGLSRLVTGRRRSVSARTIRSSGSICATGMAQVAPESGVHICLRAKSTG